MKECVVAIEPRICSIIHYRRLSVAFGSYLLTYLLTPLSRVLLEKLASLQLVKKFPAFYGTRRFLTALTSVRHLLKKKQLKL